MPADPKQQLPQKKSPQSPAPGGDIPSIDQGQKKKKPAPKPPEKKLSSQEKDDAFKYEMQYANGGFNNGVEVKPDKDGKAQLKIAIYGGGEQKVMKLSPMPDSIAKMIKAYELSATSNQDTPEITTELQKYFDKIRTLLSAKIIQIVTRMDEEIKIAITETFKDVNKEY